MPKFYVIQTTSEWLNKNGEKVKDINYFQRSTCFGMANAVTGKLNEAKVYEYISEARKDFRERFGGRNAKIITLQNDPRKTTE